MAEVKILSAQPRGVGLRLEVEYRPSTSPEVYAKRVHELQERLNEELRKKLKFLFFVFDNRYGIFEVDKFYIEFIRKIKSRLNKIYEVLKGVGETCYFPEIKIENVEVEKFRVASADTVFLTVYTRGPFGIPQLDDFVKARERLLNELKFALMEYLGLKQELEVVDVTIDHIVVQPVRNGLPIWLRVSAREPRTDLERKIIELRNEILRLVDEFRNTVERIGTSTVCEVLNKTYAPRLAEVFERVNIIEKIVNDLLEDVRADIRRLLDTDLSV